MVLTHAYLKKHEQEAKCGSATYLYSDIVDDVCFGRGGIKTWLRQRSVLFESIFPTTNITILIYRYPDEQKAEIVRYINSSGWTGDDGWRFWSIFAVVRVLLARIRYPFRRR